MHKLQNRNTSKILDLYMCFESTRLCFRKTKFSKKQNTFSLDFNLSLSDLEYIFTVLILLVVQTNTEYKDFQFSLKKKLKPS